MTSLLDPPSPTLVSPTSRSTPRHQSNVKIYKAGIESGERQRMVKVFPHEDRGDDYGSHPWSESGTLLDAQDVVVYVLACILQ